MTPSSSSASRGPRTWLGVLGLAVALTASAAFLLAASPSAAEDQPSEAGPPAWAYQMAHELMSPFCPGRTLSACPSPQADELRQWILFQALAGRTREDIERSLADRYGDVLLSTPRAEGWGLSAYMVPVGAFLIGGGFVAWLLRRLVGGSTSGAPNSSASFGLSGSSERALASRTRSRTSGPSPGPSERSPAAEGEGDRGARHVSDSDLERLVDEELARS